MENLCWYCYRHTCRLYICNSFHFPVAERGAMFLFANGDKDVFEVAVFAESCRSWLIDNTVQQGKRSNNFF